MDHLAGGYPHPTSAAATAVMKGNRKRDTRPEVALRSALHRLGARYRCDFPIPLPNRRLVRVDIAFLGPRVAVFLDGCFWHRCPEHSTTPRANAAYWESKFARNVARDDEVDRALAEVGWRSIRVWEHEAADVAALRVLKVLGGPSSTDGLDHSTQSKID